MVADASESGAWGRAWRLGKLGVGLTGSYLGYQLQNLFLNTETKSERQKSFHHRASRRMRLELESLKGPVMKIGQLLGMQTQALPPETIQELATLQNQAPAMHPTLARAQFKASLGHDPEEIFREFDPVPVAAASLGQVHRAVTRQGQTVAVKIQYPAIRRAIENDFKLVRSATWPGHVSGHFPRCLVDEMEEGILKEIDYRNEADNLEQFRAWLRPFPNVTVPEVYRKLSTDRVLTMSFVPGITLHEWASNHPSQKRRDQLGGLLMELFNYQVYWLGALHADPHPGNYLIGQDDRIGMVDFGCVKRYSRDMAELVRCFTDRVWQKGQNHFERMVQLAWHPTTPSESARARKVTRAAIDYLALIYPDPRKGGTVVDFRDPAPIKKMPDMWQLVLSNKLSNPEFVFQCRAELGLYNLLHRLRSRIDTAEMTKRVMRRRETAP